MGIPLVYGGRFTALKWLNIFEYHRPNALCVFMLGYTID
jgi:hypothetical protein